MEADPFFQNSSFSLKGELCQWQQTLSVNSEFSGDVTHSLKRKCLSNTHVWVAKVCPTGVLSSKNRVTWKKWLVQLTTNTTAQVCPWRQLAGYPVKSLCTSYFIPQAKRWRFMGQESTKL
jgi:hypothetical protein